MQRSAIGVSVPRRPGLRYAPSGYIAGIFFELHCTPVKISYKGKIQTTLGNVFIVFV